MSDTVRLTLYVGDVLLSGPLDMDAAAFALKWHRSQRSERSAAQEFFLDLCAVVGHQLPGDYDPSGKDFTLERVLTQADGKKGFADAFKRDFFAWEAKKKGADLDEAYKQLLQYSGALGNPPLLIVSDMDRILIRTHFTGYPTVLHEFRLDNFDTPRNQALLKKVFFDPEALKPGETRREITGKAAKRFAEIADSFRRRQSALAPEKRTDATKFAHFLDRLVFCMFAEDSELLPEKLFTRIFEKIHRDPRKITADLDDLFRAMADGGRFWGEDIRHFNGSLFDDSPSLELDATDFAIIKEACGFDWSQMDPTIFDTLFERVMDPDQRSLLGAHYTGYDDISTLVEPVVMTPLRREWAEVRDRLGALMPERLADAQALVDAFLARLRAVRVLDPACGSGNFLYVTLHKLKDLEKEVLIECRNRGLSDFSLQIGPSRLHGIEKNPYAFDLAQMTVWIGYIQWNRDNGFSLSDDPVLQPVDTIRNMDAILDLALPECPSEPSWPEVDFIVGNPPFLGGKKLRGELKDEYVGCLFALWRDRVRPEADLCCYWFEKARQQIESGKCRRAGLLATQGIRGGASRVSLDRIKETGDIFFGESDREWMIDGANVHVSMIGFDDGVEAHKMLDSVAVPAINSNLTSIADITKARRLTENLGIAFMGDTKGGKFDITENQAMEFMTAPNPQGKPNSDIVVPWINGVDVIRRNRSHYIIDFGVSSSIADASLYEKTMEYLRDVVYPIRQSNKRQAYKERWWIHVEPRPAMRARLLSQKRFLVTVIVSKHRIFSWKEAPTLPDHQLIVFSRSDDYFLGVLHSRLHEVWARAQGTQVRERESGFRYTPTTCFETFPFPEPTAAQRKAIGKAAKRLNELRERWLNPPEWVRTEVLEFPGSVDGPWARFVHDPDQQGIGTVRYPRQIAKDAHAPELKKRTLTALYNTRPLWLDLHHQALDEAVFAAYGWEPSINDDEILTALLALNLERAGAAEPETTETETDEDIE